MPLFSLYRGHTSRPIGELPEMTTLEIRSPGTCASHSLSALGHDSQNRGDDEEHAERWQERSDEPRGQPHPDAHDNDDGEVLGDAVSKPHGHPAPSSRWRVTSSHI